MSQDAGKIEAKASRIPLTPGETAAQLLYASLPVVAASGGTNHIELASGDHRDGKLLVGFATALAQAESFKLLNAALKQGLDASPAQPAAHVAPAVLKADS